MSLIAIDYHCLSFDVKQIVFDQVSINNSCNTTHASSVHGQGCALRKIIRSPKVPNYEIQGAQHKAYMKEIRLSGRPKAKGTVA